MSLTHAASGTDRAAGHLPSRPATRSFPPLFCALLLPAGTPTRPAPAQTTGMILGHLSARAGGEPLEDVLVAVQG